MTIGVVGDLHLKDSLGYADHVADNRLPEKKLILETIVKELADCDQVVFLGDQFNAKNNSSQVIKEFVQFIEQFSDKQELVFLVGNHEKRSDGSSAIDFLKEVTNKKWITVINSPITLSYGECKIVYCPYFAKAELEAKTDEEATEKIMKMIGRGDLLFVHHAISDTLTTPGVQTNIFNEAVLPKKELEKHFELIVGGHINHPQSEDKTIVAGSIFNNECGEKEKLIWKIHLPTAKQKIKIESIPLPGRGIYKVESGRDNILKQLEKIPLNSIVKAVITTREELKEIEDIKKILQKFDAYILLEQIPDKRKKIHLEENKNLLNFTLNELLEVYAKERKVSLTQLQQGLSLIQ